MISKWNLCVISSFILGTKKGSGLHMLFESHLADQWPLLENAGLHEPLDRYNKIVLIFIWSV